MLAGVEVVMMDTVRGAIRASGGIWGGGRKHSTRNCGIPAKKLVQLKDWAATRAAWMYMGKCLTIKYYEVKTYFAFDETNECENTQLFIFFILLLTL